MTPQQPSRSIARCLAATRALAKAERDPDSKRALPLDEPLDEAKR